jgi:hypothetical protein
MASDRQNCRRTTGRARSRVAVRAPERRRRVVRDAGFDRFFFRGRFSAPTALSPRPDDQHPGAVLLHDISREAGGQELTD